MTMLMRAAEAAVSEQADAVRDLKASGKDNQDDDVKAAVAHLLERKAHLEKLQQLAEQAAAEQTQAV